VFGTPDAVPLAEANMKKLLSIAALSLMLSAGAAQAAQIFVSFGPPRPPVRRVIVARPSYRHVYVPGYYRYQGNRYGWVDGYWAVPPRHRTVWVPGYWTPRRGGYFWVAGYWR
jgi:hypothetical protein